MSGARVLVGTRKGAFILKSDGKRERWDVSGPHFGGWEIYHFKGSPADPKRLYASQSSGWFGQIIQRSSDGGKTWETVDNKFARTKAFRERTSGTTALRTPGSSSASGIWNRPSLNRTPFMRASRMRRSFARPTADNPGKSCRDFAVTGRDRPGNPGQAACACTRLFSTQPMRPGCSSPSRPPVHSGPTMAPERGGQSIAA